MGHPPDARESGTARLIIGRNDSNGASAVAGTAGWERRLGVSRGTIRSRRLYELRKQAVSFG